MSHVCEEIYQHMGGTKLSVHMEDWPVCDESLICEDIEHSTALVQNIVDVVAAERAKNLQGRPSNRRKPPSLTPKARTRKSSATSLPTAAAWYALSSP